MSDADLVVIGGGPGGYSAAFRAADLGLQVTLIERHARLGGVCLNVGCIPSKTLLHAAALIEDAQQWRERGIVFEDPRIDLDALRAWKEKTIEQMATGLAGLAKRREVIVQTGTARFLSGHTLEVQSENGAQTLRFSQAIIATGSRAVSLPGLPEDDRIFDSTQALELAQVPGRLLVIGGGVLGLEVATVYRALGAKVTVVEQLDQLMAGTDPDVVRAYLKPNASRFENIYLGTCVEQVEAGKDLKVQLATGEHTWSEFFDAILVTVGRQVVTEALDLSAAGVVCDAHGVIEVNHQQRTSVAHVFAIGDVTGAPMLAHKASHQGRVAAEVAAGMKSGFEARVIPSVAYTDPEVAWVGTTEQEAKAEGIAYERGMFPWAASGRAVSVGRTEGMTKVLFDGETRRLIGAAIVGPHAGELIGEAVLAIENGCEAEDIAGTIHPHPTFSETLAQASEAALGTLTDLYLGSKGRR